MSKKVVLGVFIGLLCLPSFALENKRHNLEVAYEHSSYTYREPHMANPIKLKSHNKNGVSAVYTMHSVLSTDVIEDDSTFAKLGFRYMGGDVSYDGWLQYWDGTVEPSSAGGLKDYYFEAFLTFGAVYDLGTSWRVGPHLGIGWRQLRNHLEEMGAGGYQRTSTYIYLPLGSDLKWQLSERTSLTLNGQFDVLLHGNQYSRVTDLPGFADDASNRQGEGYGIRVSLKAQTDISKSFGVFIEPFWRYWHIQNSDEEWFYYNGDPSQPAFPLVEPFNTTHEYGFRVGVAF